MAGIIILCVILLLLGVVLFTPIRVRARRDGEGLRAWLKLGPAEIPLYPGKPEEAGPEKPPKEKKEKKPKPEKPEKKRRKPTLEQILYLLEGAPPILGRALRRTGRRIRIRPLALHVLVSAEDPADTGLLYGRLQAALAALLPILHRGVRIAEQDIRLYPDFEGQGMDFRLDVGAAIRLWDILVIGLCAGASGVKLLVGMKKLAPKDPGGEPGKPEKPNGSKTNGADAA